MVLGGFMKVIFNFGLITLSIIFLVFPGCQKNPVGIDDDNIENFQLVPPGTYPSFETYLSTQNISRNFENIYIINRAKDIRITKQQGNTCVPHACAYALSLTYQNKYPNGFSQVQFDPSFIIDIGYSIYRNETKASYLKSYPNIIPVKDSLDFISGNYWILLEQLNDEEAYGCDIINNYNGNIDFASVKIAREYGSTYESFGQNVSIWQSQNNDPDLDKCIISMKTMLKCNLPIVLISPYSKCFSKSYVPISQEGHIHSLSDVIPGHHAITIVGWDDSYSYKSDKGAFIFINSYGEDWSNHGFGYITYDFLKKHWVSQEFLDNGEPKVSVLTSQMFVFTLNSSESEYVNKLSSFFTQVNDTQLNPLLQKEEVEVERNGDLELGFYQGNGNTARFSIKSLNGDLIDEIIVDSSINLRQRWDGNDKASPANVCIFSNDNFIMEDRIEIEYYIDDELQDTLIVSLIGELPIGKILKFNGDEVDSLVYAPELNQGETISLIIYVPDNDNYEVTCGSESIYSCTTSGEHSFTYSLPLDNSQYIYQMACGMIPDESSIILKANGNIVDTLKVKCGYEYIDCCSNYDTNVYFTSALNRVKTSPGEFEPFIENASIDDILVNISTLYDLPSSISGAIWYYHNGILHGGSGVFNNVNGTFVINGMGYSPCPLTIDDYSEEEYSEALIFIKLESGNYLLKGYFSYYVYLY